MSDLSQKLRELRHLRGITRKALSDGTGLTVQALSTYENGSATPPFETMRTLAMFYNVDPKYLMGYGDFYIDKETEDDYVSVSVLQSLPFGIPPQAVSSFDGTVTVKKEGVSKNTFAIRVQDDSMSPELQERDTVIVDMDAAPDGGDIVLAFVDYTEAKFFFFREEDSFVKLYYPAHSSLAPLVFPPVQLGRGGKGIVGVATSVIRDYMEVK